MPTVLVGRMAYVTQVAKLHESFNRGPMVQVQGCSLLGALGEGANILVYNKLNMFT